jgi:hypothetical protein
MPINTDTSKGSLFFAPKLREPLFQLSKEEAENLTFQNGISSWGGRRTPPYAFTEQGVAMLSSVLRSDRAAQVNVAIIRTFVKLREILATHEEIARKVAQHDRQISTLFEYVKTLLGRVCKPRCYNHKRVAAINHIAR